MDRFELEDKITAMDNIVEELNLLARLVLEHDLDKDDIASTLFGIRILHEGRQAELFDTFTQVFKLDEYSEFAKETFNNAWSTYSSNAEDTNPSVDVNFNNIRSCCRKSNGND
jgi:hypothetical protein